MEGKDYESFFQNIQTPMNKAEAINGEVVPIFTIVFSSYLPFTILITPRFSFLRTSARANISSP